MVYSYDIALLDHIGSYTDLIYIEGNLSSPGRLLFQF